MTQDVISEESLLFLLNAALQDAGIDTTDCEFASISWHETNASGCNWTGHLDPDAKPIEVVKYKVQVISQQLSEKYNIPGRRYEIARRFNIPDLRSARNKKTNRR